MFGIEIQSAQRLLDTPRDGRAHEGFKGYVVLERRASVSGTGHVQPLIRIRRPGPLDGFACGRWMADFTDRPNMGPTGV